ncbi:MAG: hypothetical protein ABI416_11555 [Ginsengibacter sp.]
MNTALILIDLQKSIVQFPLAHPVDVILENVSCRSRMNQSPQRV